MASPIIPPALAALALRLLERPATTAEYLEARKPAVFLEAVDGIPELSPNKWSADHHRLVPRPFYDCAAKQVLVALSEGLVEHLTEGMAGATVDVYIVRVDEDVAVAYALLRWPDLALIPSVRRLVALEDTLDRTGGTSRGDASEEELGLMSWLFEPYHCRRANDGIADHADACAVLLEVAERLRALGQGKARTSALVGEFEVLERVGPVALVREWGPYARLGLRQAGIDAYVTERLDGDRRILTVGLTSAFVPLDLVAAYDALNALEGERSDGDRWGGGTHIGGSPFAGTDVAAADVLHVLAGRYRKIA